ncbi:cytochrome c peroxidase [Neolewinella lacunae]|uniref:Methylamine utilization protein MauG n=1 Tax=Neolewinella lacunae TaxID=1517758 RepID=A0A923PNA7_9BACT|nr:cytochrome c peroxidase [Neolewinella lacunae]MBC6994816.1 cytochrome-c peroxidase [Neolewinella lacunae]MDN3634438.1 cytochrome c peroxidase [Neolewinella lacunae]
MSTPQVSCFSLRYGLLALASIVVLVLTQGTCASPQRQAATPAGASDLGSAYGGPISTWPAAELDSGAVFVELGPLPKYAGPAYTAEQIALGKDLFFDPRLSASNQISCASCHTPELGWGDGLIQSIGHDRQRGKRNAPSLLNVADWQHFFWDGRATSLEAQVFFPIQAHDEMNQSLEDLPDKLAAIPGYPEKFKAAFQQDSIQLGAIAQAIAAFETTIRSRESRFDRFVKGHYDALTEQEIRGLDLFRTKARCINCHNGPLFSDQQFHNSGQHLIGRSQEDLGRFLITQDSADIGKFRTPSLRDIAFTGPYLHHGNVLELREVLTMYNSGMPQIIPKSLLDKQVFVPTHDPLFQPLGLDDGEIDDLLAFLQAISTRPRPIRTPG